ncbi:SixA phosphatase family protein [Elusimicrobium minutum]|nr:phosphoglycerate mutase family protein [Elusimicrobium minutum]
MTSIIFMRHSYALDALESGAKTDAGRVLSTKGITAAEQASKALELRGVKPVKILSSTLKRAIQTAEITSKHFNVPVKQNIELNGGLPTTKYWQFIKENSVENKTIIVISHNPDISVLISALANEHISLAPAEFAVISFEENFSKAILEPIVKEDLNDVR